MKRNLLWINLVLVLSLLLAACSAAPAATEAMTDKDTESGEMMEDKSGEEAMMEDKAGEEMIEGEDADGEMMEEDKSDGEMMDDGHDDGEMMEEEPTEEAMLDDKSGEEGMMAAPAWFAVTLTDVNSGENFTISDLKGKVVLVETMAMWCSNCRQQQNQVKELHDLLGERADFVSLGLDIDVNEVAGDLKNFTAQNGYTWRYAISPAEVSQDLAALYGNQFLNPPSTPMLIIDRHGEVHPLPFGIKSAADLLEALQPFLDESM